MLNFGILGCGRIGQVHARAIMNSPDARVAAVSDFVPAAADALALKASAKAMTSDEIIANPSIDAVIIGTPTTTHYDLIHQAAAAGKAIFCEKPIDLNADRIRDCLKAVDAGNVPFMVAFNRRFDPNFAGMQARIVAGEVGNVELVTILSRDPSAPPIDYIKSSGGIFRDMMIHDLDMARFLLGEDPVSLHATGSCLVDPAIGEAGDFDTAAVTLRTASGKICQINNSRRASYGYDQRVEIHGSKGMIRADNILESSVEVATENGFRRAPPLNFFLERYEAAYANELAHFVAALKTGVSPTPNGVDGLKAQLLADAAAESCADGLVKKFEL
jgi:myo-inositol 2-dehydrogenase/D-chiro-inositol 1-dehydrogenase